MKSSIKSKRPIQWGKVIVIEELYANEQSIKSLEESLRASNPNITEEQINKDIQTLVMRDNYFNRVMDEISSCYEVDYNEDDIKERVALLKVSQAGNTEEHITAMAKVGILKKLIYNDLAHEWDIQVSDELAKTTLENFYKTTGNPIREYLTDREKFDNVKDTILEQIISERITNAFKGEFRIQKNTKS